MMIMADIRDLLIDGPVVIETRTSARSIVTTRSSRDCAPFDRSCLPEIFHSRSDCPTGMTLAYNIDVTRARLYDVGDTKDDTLSESAASVGTRFDPA